MSARTPETESGKEVMRMNAKRRRRRSRRQSRWTRRLGMVATVLALSGGSLTAASNGGHVSVTSGGPARCIVFRASPLRGGTH